MEENKLNLRPNLLRLLRHLSVRSLNYLNQFRKRSNILLLSPLMSLNSFAFF